MKKSLNEVASITLGYPFRGKVEETDAHHKDEAAIPVIQLRNTSILEGIDYQSCAFVKITGKANNHYLQDQDILFAARNNHNYSVRFEKNSAINRDYIASPNFFIIRITDKNILPDFLEWQLNQVICQQYFARNKEGTFTKNIRREIMESLPISIPSLEIQQAIVKLAQTQQRERQILTKLIQNNEQVMNAIAQNLITED